MDGFPATLAACGPHTACRARRRSHHRETTPPWFLPRWPRSRACRFQPWIRARAGDSAELRHPFHAMIAGHVTGEKQRRDYRDRRPDRRRLRMGQSRPPGGAVRAVLSLSSPPPQRPRPHSLAGAPGSRGGSAPVVWLSACGPMPGSAPGSAEAQVLTFGMSSQRVV